MAKGKTPGGKAGRGSGTPEKLRGAKMLPPRLRQAPKRGRPSRLAHLVPGSDRSQRRARALEAGLAGASVLAPEQARAKVPDSTAGRIGDRGGDILCLPNPEWLPHALTITGSTEQLTSFRNAAAGSGTIPWRQDYNRLEEDWLHQLLGPPPAERGISVHGARIAAREMRDAIETLELRTLDGGRGAGCPLDLNALVPVPLQLLSLGPADPAVLAWLWQNWGTTWMLRDVEETPVGRAEMPVQVGHAAICFRFVSADWTPWRALVAMRARWPELIFSVKLLAVTE